MLASSPPGSLDLPHQLGCPRGWHHLPKGSWAHFAALCTTNPLDSEHLYVVPEYCRPLGWSSSVYLISVPLIYLRKIRSVCPSLHHFVWFPLYWDLKHSWRWPFRQLMLQVGHQQTFPVESIEATRLVQQRLASTGLCIRQGILPIFTVWSVISYCTFGFLIASFRHRSWSPCPWRHFQHLMMRGFTVKGLEARWHSSGSPLRKVVSAGGPLILFQNFSRLICIAYGTRNKWRWQV